MAAYISKPVASALVFVNKLLMVIAKQVQDSGLKIMNMNRIFDNIISQFICLPIDDSRFDPTACHPYTKAAWMVIAAITIRLKFTLAIIRASEFATPDHQRFIQHTTVLQILYQGSRSLIDTFCKVTGPIGQILVRIPAHMIKLNESNASFGNASCQNAVRSKGTGLQRIGTIKFKRAFRLIRKVHHFRHRGLHPVRHFILCYSRCNFRITELLLLNAIERSYMFKHFTPALLVGAGRVLKIQYRVLSGLQVYALMNRVEKTISPIPGSKRLNISRSA